MNTAQVLGDTAAVAGKDRAALAVDAIVVGGGVTGLTAAVVLARRHPDARVALVAPVLRPNGGDGRTAALFPDSLALIDEALGHAGAADLGSPLAGIRMVDVTGHLLRAPDVLFEASEIGLPAFGWNIANTELVAALEAAAGGIPNLERVASLASGAEISDREIAVLTDSDSVRITAPVALAADGRHSLLRRHAGISTRTWDHGQQAMTSRFNHSAPHHGISTELHGRGGPCTSVPMAGRSSSLVWMEPTEEAARLTADSTSDAAGPAFVAALAAKVGAFLGRISDVAPPRSIPLAHMLADHFAARRVLLVGETGHVFPPIGAQGLNLGLRDAAAAVASVSDALAAGRDPGDAMVLETYDRGRRIDVAARTYGVDLLNRSLVSNLPLLPLVRGAGLHLLSAIPPLKKLAMRRGLAGIAALPTVGR